MFKIFVTQNFNKLILKVLSKEERIKFRKKLPVLEEKGNLIGKPLSPYYLRELKFSGKRIYYVVFSRSIILVSVSNKKLQNKEINKIRKILSELRERFDI